MKRLWALAGIIAAACANASNPAVDAKAEEQAIRQLDEQWAAAATRKDAAAVVSFYSPDGVALWQDRPVANGREPLQKLWQDEFASSATGKWAFIPVRIDVFPSGDVATDWGRAEVEVNVPAAPQKLVVKYLVVWKKVDGKWKVFYDMWNTYAPMKP